MADLVLLVPYGTGFPKFVPNHRYLDNLFQNAHLAAVACDVGGVGIQDKRSDSCPLTGDTASRSLIVFIMTHIMTEINSQ